MMLQRRLLYMAFSWVDSSLPASTRIWNRGRPVVSCTGSIPILLRKATLLRRFRKRFLPLPIRTTQAYDVIATLSLLRGHSTAGAELTFYLELVTLHLLTGHAFMMSCKL